MDRKKNRRISRKRTSSLSELNPSSDLHQSPFLHEPPEFLREHLIRKKLDEATINRELKAERFITQKSLGKIWEWDVLKQFLEILGFEDDEKLVENVHKELLKTLSILVAIRWDNWLAFPKIFLEYDQGMLRHDRNDTAIPYALKTLEDSSFLGKDFAPDFFLAQYSYIPIVIEQGKHSIYPRTQPLPFIRSKAGAIAKGGYGVVTKEVIARHQFLPKHDIRSKDLNTDEVAVARKWFPAKGDFRKEARNLATLNSSLSNHERVVKYLAIITIGDEEDEGSSKEFNILLPLADTDLKHFLYDQEYEAKCRGVVELINEASLIADAIIWLHNGLRIDGKLLVCCHLDLSLSNVLVYFSASSPVGCWKISDFGISSMSEREDEQPAPRQPVSALLSVSSPAQSLARITGTIKTSVRRPAGPFSAPEVEIGSEIGRPSDIWSFGCILFQVLARASGGIKLLHGLDEKRASMENGSRNDYFCQQTSEGKILHGQARAWLESKDSMCDGSHMDRIAVANCKDLILETLSIATKGRPNAERLHKELANIANGNSKRYNFDQYGNMIIPSIPTFQHCPIAVRTIYSPPSVPTITDNSQPNGQVPRVVLHSPPLLPIIEDPSRSPGPPPSAIPEPQDQVHKLSLPTEDNFDYTSSSPASKFIPRPASVSTIVTDKPPLNTGRRATDPGLPTDNENFVQTSPPTIHDYPPPEYPGRCLDQTYIADVKEEIPFQPPPHVKMTLISSTLSKVAFISPQKAVISTIYCPRYEKTISAPMNCLWEKAGLAGGFLALRGSSRVDSAQPFHLYKLSVVNQDLQILELLPIEALPSFEKFTVSRDGSLLFGGAGKLWLYQSFNQPPQKLNTSMMGRGELQQVWFSTDGLLAFAWFSLPGNLHRVGIWNVANVGITGIIEHQIPTSDNSAVAVKTMVHFPQLPLCLVWKEHDIVFLIQNPALSIPQGTNWPHFKHLQAAVVTPNEEAIVFIRSSKCVARGWIRIVSKISVGKIVGEIGHYRTIGEISEEEILVHHLDKPSRCDVVIEALPTSRTHVRVLIAHSNGNFEIREVKLPGY